MCIVFGTDFISVMPVSMLSKYKCFFAGGALGAYAWPALKMIGPYPSYLQMDLLIS